jgi:hypothetical protein
VLRKLVSYLLSGSTATVTPAVRAWSTTGIRFSAYSAFAAARSSGVMRHVRPTEA